MRAESYARDCERIITGRRYRIHKLKGPVFVSNMVLNLSGINDEIKSDIKTKLQRRLRERRRRREKRERGKEGKKAARQLLRSHCISSSGAPQLFTDTETARNITREQNARRLMALRDTSHSHWSCLARIRAAFAMQILRLARNTPHSSQVAMRRRSPRRH